MTSMSDGFIAALKAGFLATKKRPTTVIARLHFTDSLLLNTIKYCLSKSFTYNQKLSKKNRPNSSTLLLFYFLVIFLQTYWQSKQWKTSPGRPKDFPWSLVYVTFLSMSCISNVFHRISPSLAFTNIGLRWSKMASVEFHFARASLTCFAHVLRSRAKLGKRRGKQVMSQTCVVRHSADTSRY